MLPVFFLRNIFLLSGLMTMPASRIWAQGGSVKTVETYRAEVTQQVRQKVAPVLSKFCGESCDLVNVQVDIEETMPDSDEWGFESSTTMPLLTPIGANLQVQIDDRVAQISRERLQKILISTVQGIVPNVNVGWSIIEHPQIGVADGLEEQLKEQLQSRVDGVIRNVIEQYCPHQCILADLEVEGRMISHDQAANIPGKGLVRDKTGRGILKVDQVKIEMTFDEALAESDRDQILQLLRAKTKFVDPVSIESNVAAIPESARAKKEKSQDPYGLDKLRETLKIFRDMAGTKEIVTTSKDLQSIQSSEKTASSSEKELRANEKISSSSKENNSQQNTNSESSTSLSEKTDASKVQEKSLLDQNFGLVIGASALVLFLLVFLLLRYAGKKKDETAINISDARPASGESHGENARGGVGGVAAMPGFVAGGAMMPAAAGYGAFPMPPEVSKQEYAEALKKRTRIDRLHHEILASLALEKSTSREVFARLLKEESVERTARYVHLLGTLVVMDVVEDPALRRNIEELAEFYHKAQISLSDDEKLSLFESLHQKIVAQTIKSMTQKSSGLFDFVKTMAPKKIVQLFEDENLQVQSILMTQIDAEKRREIFELMSENTRLQLMRALASTPPLPKDYLQQLAQALKHKLETSPALNAEELPTQAALYEILETSEFKDQYQLMTDLMRTQPDVARNFKKRLITISMLPFLRDGHLIEVLLGIERQDLLQFLAGAPDVIRNAVLSRSPQELVESWIEDFRNAQVQTDKILFGRASREITERIARLAQLGYLNVAEINDRIFPQPSPEYSFAGAQGSQVAAASAAGPRAADAPPPPPSSNKLRVA